MSKELGIADDICARMVNWRHDLHAHPETAFEEHRTAQVVADALMEMQISVHRGLGVTGVVGTLKNGEGPSIALRADMDALNMQELGASPHKSSRDGKMHGNYTLRPLLKTMPADDAAKLREILAEP